MAVFQNYKNRNELKQKFRDDGDRLRLEGLLNTIEFDMVAQKNLRTAEGNTLPVTPPKNAEELLQDNAYQVGKAVRSLKLIMADLNSALDIAGRLNVSGELRLYNRNAKRFRDYIRSEELDTNNFAPLWNSYKLESLAGASKRGLLDAFQMQGYDADFNSIGNSIKNDLKRTLSNEPVKLQKAFKEVDALVLEKDLQGLSLLSHKGKVVKSKREEPESQLERLRKQFDFEYKRERNNVEDSLNEYVKQVGGKLYRIR